MNVILIQASPRVAATGATTAVRLAGGGSRAYDQLGFTDWRSGIAKPPRFTSALGFDQYGLTGGAIPQTASVRFFPSDRALLSTLAGYLWTNADITISSGDDEAASPTYGTILTGKVSAISVEGGVLSLTISDLSNDLAKSTLPDTFAGTGDLEGGVEATGRAKRRTWGYAWNVEGRVLDKAYNIYEFGDPLRPLQDFPTVKDKGEAGVAPVVVAWAGTALATLTALRASSPPPGGAAIAPSIACVKWWTIPAGPLTADIKGEVGAGYVDTAPEIVARIVSVYSTSVTVANLATALTWQSARAGVHVGDAGETVQQLIDRLLLPLSITWTLSPAGALTFRRLTWSGPVASLAAIVIARKSAFKPLRKRKVGYQANNRKHTDGEISAALAGLIDGPNRVAFSRFESNGAGWLVTDPTPIATTPIVATPTLGHVAGKISYTATGANTITISTAVDYVFPTTEAERLAVIFGIEATGPVDTIDGYIGFYDSSGAYFGQQLIKHYGGPQSFNTKIAGFVNVPTGAVSAALKLVMVTTGAGSGYLSIIDPIVTQAPSGSYIYPSFVAGPNAFKGADVTALAQIVVVKPGDFTVLADYAGTIAGGQLPKTATVIVTRGGTDITLSNDVSYSLANVSTNLAGTGTLAIDNTNGSSTKGVVTLNTPLAGSGTFDISVSVLGIAQPNQTVKVTFQKGDSPAGGGSGTSASGSIDGQYLVGTTYVEVFSALGMTLASGKTIRAYASSDYDHDGSSPTTSNALAKWQYATAGTSFASPTDFAGPVAGSSAHYDYRDISTSQGGITCNQTAAPAAGSYDVRLMMACNNSGGLLPTNSGVSVNTLT